MHTDLLAAALIADPYLDQNEHELKWIGRCDWKYSTTFGTPEREADRVDLVCGGLDTFATVEVNGTLVGTTRNMHRSYRIPVQDVLAGDANELVVTFASAVLRSRELRDTVGDLPRPVEILPEPYQFARKMACNFGWDWGPELVTAGIWKLIQVHAWSVARFDKVRPIISVAGTTGMVRVEVELERAGAPHDVELTASVGGSQQTITIPGAETTGEIELEVDHADLWWPHGMGAQARYELTLTLETETGLLDTWARQIGFRTIELDTAADDGGSAFTLIVNDRPIFGRGANWIPDDCFPTRVSSDRYRRRLEQARDANVNLLRVWGGGLYETDDFYEACDELGILVWQDFPFACAAYPEELLADEVEAEARENIVRLMPHPSLALWNGNNENIWGWHDWGWQEQLEDRPWGLGLYVDLLPALLAEIDPTRPYWPGSPYSGSMDVAPNADEHGCTHLWDVWNERDYTAYRDHVPRFVAEFGYQAPPTWTTLTRAVHDNPLTPDSAGILSHQKADDGHAKLTRGLATHFRAPVTTEDWHFATQLNQARAITLGVEHFRSHRGQCMGAIVWQLNDCWPAISWSAIDSAGRQKPMWYALRRAYADRMLTIQPDQDGLAAVAVNDGDASWHGTLRVERRSFAGDLLADWKSQLSVRRDSTSTFRLPPNLTTPGEPARELLVADVGGMRTTWFFCPDKDLDYPAPSYDIDFRRDGDDALMRVCARTLLRDVAIFVDRLDAHASVDDMLVTLLPGEERTIRIHNGARLPAERLRQTPVFRCANDLNSGT
nr:glycoside hydrolase family 2 protein [Jiangella aurantiaca]